MEESNVQPVRCPVTVCGDIHGQFVRLPRVSPRPTHLIIITTPHSTTSPSSFASAATLQIPTTSSWATTSTEGTTLSRPSRCSWPSSCGTETASPSSAGITSPDKSRRCMDSTMNVYENMEMRTCGDISLTCSIIFL